MWGSVVALRAAWIALAYLIGRAGRGRGGWDWFG